MMDPDEKKAYQEGRDAKEAELKQKRIEAAKKRGEEDAEKGPLAKQFIKEGIKQLKGFFG